MSRNKFVLSWWYALLSLGVILAMFSVLSSLQWVENATVYNMPAQVCVATGTKTHQGQCDVTGRLTFTLLGEQRIEVPAASGVSYSVPKPSAMSWPGNSVHYPPGFTFFGAAILLILVVPVFLALWQDTTTVRESGSET